MNSRALCQATCDAVMAAGSGANVSLVFGCPAGTPDDECAGGGGVPPVSIFCRDNPDAPECLLE